MGKQQRQTIIERLTTVPQDEGRVILATGKYIGEGFDDPRLDALFLTLPVSWRLARRNLFRSKPLHFMRRPDAG